MMVFKLAQSAEKSWYRLKGFKLLADVITGVKFKDGSKSNPRSNRRSKRTHTPDLTIAPVQYCKPYVDYEVYYLYYSFNVRAVNTVYLHSSKRVMQA